MMETNDRFRDWNDGKKWPMEQLTVMTGPVFVEGAQPGQVLTVDILDVRPTQGFGYVIGSRSPGQAGRLANGTDRHRYDRSRDAGEHCRGRADLLHWRLALSGANGDGAGNCGNVKDDEQN